MQTTLQKSTPEICQGQAFGQEVSRAKIFRSAVLKEGLTEQEADSFLRLLDCSKAQLPKIDPNGLSLRMLKICSPLIVGSTLRPFSIHWPPSAIVSSMDYSIQSCLEYLKIENESTLSLIDILEPEVDPKYFLSPQAMAKLLSNS